MQRDVVDVMLPFASKVVEPIKKALTACRRNSVPVVHVVRVHRPDGSDVELFRREKFRKQSFLVKGTAGAEIVGELKPVDGEYVVEKQRFSAFFQTELPLLLKSLDVKTLVVAGVQTPNCVRATAVDGVGHDFEVFVLSDATAASSVGVHEANLFDLKNMGVNVITVGEFVRLLK